MMNEDNILVAFGGFFVAATAMTVIFVAVLSAQEALPLNRVKHCADAQEWCRGEYPELYDAMNLGESDDLQ